ncbi:hypothetical protein TYRP_012706, partial [Tyrophagus putrescentiae]
SMLHCLTLQIIFRYSSSTPSPRPVLKIAPFEDANKKDYSVGLIQFSEPVIIHELRIVPLSTLVTSDTLKGGRLGATIPSSFEVHFYVNDLKTKNASTFLDIGSLSYKEHERFIFKPTLHVPTDALFLRGLFESLTIAVLGSVTDINRLTTAVPTSKSSGTLHTKDHRGFDSSHTSNSYDEIKSIDEEDGGGGGDGRGGHNSSLDKSIEIKEPDDLDEDFEEDEDAAALDFSVFPPHRTGPNASSSSSAAAAVPSHTHLPPRHSRPESASDTEQQPQQPHPNNNSENHYHRHHYSKNSKQLNSDSAVPSKPSAEEVHSLSPSPVNLRHFARIRSPSSHSHSPSQRSLHSNSSLGLSCLKGYDARVVCGGGGNREAVRSRTSRDSSSSLPYHYQGGQKGSGGGLPSKYSNTHSLSPSNSNSNSPAPYASSVKGSTLRSTRVGDSPPARYRSDYHHHERERDYHYRDRDSHHHHHHHLPSTSVERDQHHQRREASTASSHHSSSHRDHHHDRYYEYKYHHLRGAEGGEHRSGTSSSHQRSSPIPTASHSRSYGGRSSGGGGGGHQQQLRSRSPSRESLYGRTAYLRSLGDQPGGTGARSTASGSGGSGDSSSRRSLSRDRRRSQSPFLPSRREVSGSGSSSRDQRGSGGGGRGDRDYHLYASDRDRGGRPLSRSPIPPPPPSASTSKHYYASSSSSSVATPSYSLYRSAASSSRRSRSASPVASGGLKRRYRSPPVPYDHHHQQQQGQYSSSSYRGSSPPSLHLRRRRSRDSSLEAGRHYGAASGSSSVARSPDHKRSRYTLHRMDSPAVQQQQLSPARSSHYKAEGSRHSLRSISPLRRSPPRSPPHRSSRGVSKVSSRLSSSSSPRRYHQSKLPSTKPTSSSSEHHHRLLSPPPYNSSNSNNNKSSISPHSSLSNVSLRSLEQDNKVVVVIGEGGRGSRSSSAGGKRSVNGATTMAERPLPMTTITPSSAGAAELNGTGEVNGLEKVTTTSSKTDDDLFEPLSPSDDLLLLDMPDELSPPPSDVIKSAENYDKISIASDVGLDAVMTMVNDEVALVSSESAKPSIEKPSKTALLEAISSDEDDLDDDPFDDLDDLNTAAAAVLSSENLAKSGSRDGFADVEGSNEFQKKKDVVDFVGKEEEKEEEEEEEVDSGATAADLDLSSRLFDPFALDQLRPLVFPLNSNPATSFIDERLFAVIVRLVEEKFSALYNSSSSSGEDEGGDDVRRRRGDLINELWVKDVEQLAAEIMKLGSPINVNRGGLPSNTSATSAEDCPKSTTSNDHQLERLTSTLIAITKDGLDFELAFSAQKQAFKVRHLKAGAKLFTALFSSLELRCPAAQGGAGGGGGLQLSSRLLAANLPHDLLLLYSRPYMTLSLRLLLLNGLAVLADHPEGVAYLCNEKLPWPDVDPAVASYVLTLILQPRQNSRLTSVFEELLEKVHLFELCRTSETLEAMLGQLLASFHRLSDRVHRPLRLLVPNVCQYEVKTAVHASAPLLLLLSSASSAASVQSSSDKTEAQGGDQAGGGGRTPEQLFSFIRTRLSCRHLACSSSKLALLSTAAFYRYLKHFDLLALLVRLLEQGAQVQKVVVPLLDAITSHQTGRKFLLEDQRNADLANAAHRLHTLNLVDGILQSIYASQLLLLQKESDKEGDSDPEEQRAAAICNFRPSTTSTASTRWSTWSGRCFARLCRLAAACIQYLPEGQLVHFYDVYGQLLLRSIQLARESAALKESSATQKEDKTSSATTKLPPPPPPPPKKSSDIYHSHVLQYASLGGWLSPLQSGGTTTTTTTGGGNFSHEELTIRLYVTVLKKAADAVRERLNATTENSSSIYRGLFSAVFQPELVTSVKVLAALCDPAADAAKNQAPALQLKYRHSLLHCYSYDLVSYLLTLLEALTETCLRPSHLTLAAAAAAAVEGSSSSFARLFMKSSSSSEAGKHSPEQPLLNTSFVLQGGGATVLEFIRPSVRLLRLILRYLLASVGAGFADATPVPVLLRLYHYLHFYQQQQQQQLSVKNSTTAGSSRLQQLMMMGDGSETVAAADIQREIVDLLLSVYTAVFVEHSASEEALAKKSVWTKMVRSLLAFTAASPAHFASGLALLGRLLPPPLPVPPSSTSKKLTDFELLHLVTYRKLWAAHLHVLKAELEQLVRLLLLADCPLVRRRRLRALCRALCSLHTPTVTALARSLIEGLVQALNTALACAWDSSEVGVGGFRQAVVTVSRTLDLTVHLFSASVPFRIALLNGLYLLVNGEAARREPSKIYKLLGKLFKCLFSKRLERFSSGTSQPPPPLSSGRLLRNILAEEDRLDGSTATTADHHDRPPLSRLLVEYFEKNRSLIVVAVTTTSSSEEEGEPSNSVFRFPEKLASRYTTSTSEALNDYFSRHFQSANQNDSGSSAEGALPMTMIKEENKEVVVKVEGGGGGGGGGVVPLPPPRSSSEDIVIYSPELAALALSGPLCDDDDVEDEEEDSTATEFRANLIALSQKYFGASKDTSGSGGRGSSSSSSSCSLLKTLEVLFSAVVEPSELQAAGHQYTGEGGGGGGSGGDHQHSNMMRSGGMHHHHHHHHGGMMMNHGHGGGGGHLSSGGGGNKQRLLMRSGGGRNHHSSRNFGGGGGGGGVRNHHDPFRSRPPNTSRPPSMHVDDFVALEQRQDTSGGGSMKNNARSSGGGLNNSSSSVSASSSSYQGGGGGGKDYHMLRKKNPPSSHLSSSSTSSPHHSQHHHPHHLSMGRAGGNSSSALQAAPLRRRTTASNRLLKTDRP